MLGWDGWCKHDKNTRLLSGEIPHPLLVNVVLKLEKT